MPKNTFTPTALTLLCLTAAGCGVAPTDDSTVTETQSAFCSQFLCDDHNACTSDLCISGFCRHIPISCFAPDQCHNRGTCNPSTGVCSNPPKADGTACDDGSLCTLADSCQAGVCNGAPVVCTPQDPDHATGYCDTGTGVCTNPPCVVGSYVDGTGTIRDYRADPGSCSTLAASHVNHTYPIHASFFQVPGGNFPFSPDDIGPYVKSENNCSFVMSVAVTGYLNGCYITFYTIMSTNPL